MKKQYVKPEMMMIDMEPWALFATSGLGVSGEQGDSKEDFSTGRRGGTWGNLWTNENR